MLGALLTKWTIRLALACYVAYLAGWLSGRNTHWPRLARAIWTLGCILFVVHVACAFHFYHHWSHAVAWRHTADRTQQLLGVAVGDGIFFSYLFLVLWVLDVLWLWPEAFAVAIRRPGKGSPPSPATGDAICVPGKSPRLEETPWWRVVVHIFLLFVAINGAIVFESGPTRWAGILAIFALVCLAIRRAYNSLRRKKCAREFAHKTVGDETVSATC
jgi:hypothetical protein